jgi:endonuclease/exonuclease/phosphatase (EEP) superfamily protein YafD
MLQEAQFHPGKECILDTYAYEAAANIEVDKGYYGVLTASKSTAVEAKAFLSEEKELLIATHKSLLLSKYRFKDGRELLLVNVHAINFRENRAYEREKKRLEAFLSSYPGAVILSGDFNTWSSTRQKILQKSISKLNLTQVPFSDNDQVKSFMGNHLDMVFYRGLTLLDHTVLDDEGISDHRPLFIRFSLQEDISS